MARSVLNDGGWVTNRGLVAKVYDDFVPLKLCYRDNANNGVGYSTCTARGIKGK